MSNQEKDNRADDAPIIKLNNALIQQAISDRAVWVEVIPGEKSVKVFYQIPGKGNRLAMTIPKNLQVPLTKRFKMMAGLDRDNSESQSGSVEFIRGQRRYTVDITTELTRFGETLHLAIAPA